MRNDGDDDQQILFGYSAQAQCVKWPTKPRIDKKFMNTGNRDHLDGVISKLRVFSNFKLDYWI